MVSTTYGTSGRRIDRRKKRGTSTVRSGAKRRRTAVMKWP